jgi:hypothetical protein
MYQTQLRTGQLRATGLRRPEQVAPAVTAARLGRTDEDLGQIEASG